MADVNDEYGANLFNGTRNKNRSISSIKNGNRLSKSQKSESELSSDFEPLIPAGKLAALKDWRNGVTGRIHFATNVRLIDEESSSLEGDERSRNGITSNGINSSNGRVESQGVAQDRSAHMLPVKELDKPEQPLPEDPNDPHGPRKRIRRVLCVEIEKCFHLKGSFAKLFSFKSGSMNPFVLIRLNGREVGRTPALRNVSNPIWHDELFQFPICTECKDISFEVWTTMNASVVQHDADFVGKCSINVTDLMKNSPMKEGEFQNHILELKRWHVKGNDFGAESSTCQCPGKVSEKNQDEGIFHRTESANTRETIRVSKPKQILRKKRLDSLVVERPSDLFTPSNKFKVERNPYPFRRKDVREYKKSDEDEPFFKSTSFRALSLIMMYMSFGVAGFSFIFEKWSLRNSIYFSVVTFTTVGYGDISPKSRGGKLFSCFFAFMGIGIIGIALGYVGQNLIQAQVAALQRNPQSSEEKEMKDAQLKLKRQKKNSCCSFSLSDIKAIVMFFLPLAAMVGIGSFVVGYIENWSWVNAFYWCVMTGTSVGYGDFYPKTGSAIWFCIFFIPISVGVISAALGRIANIFVEREIRKANTKLLNREVTLEDLEAMNADGDGEVSPLEFIEHMLLVMNKVDQQLLDELHAQFERLDADGSGGLQQDDLDILTDRKLEEYRTLALEEYRASLLNKDSYRPMKSINFPQIVPS